GHAVELWSRIFRRSESFEPLRAVLRDERDARECLDILNNGRSAERAYDRGERRLHAWLSAMSLDRFDESCFFAADVRAGAARDGDVEIKIRSEDSFAEESFGARFFECFVEDSCAVIELAANVDVRHRIRSN